MSYERSTRTSNYGYLEESEEFGVMSGIAEPQYEGNYGIVKEFDWDNSYRL